jgi:putative acetyltransferase
MKDALIIRSETSGDAEAISEVTMAAFATLPISNHTEQFIIAVLRAANAITISLVAEIDGRTVGHIAFSPVTLSDGFSDWYGLGPMSVLPEYQHQGIGKALIEEGLARLKDLDAKGCCQVGHPEYYRQFGFGNTRELAHEGYRRKSFLFFLSTDRCRKAPLSSTRVSEPMGKERHDLCW